jgi:O-antigen biosynthesis protein
MIWQAIYKRIQKLIRHGQEVSYLAAVRSLTSEFRERYAAKFTKRKVLASYAFISNTRIGLPFVDGQASRNTLNWVIPPVGRGSGGHLNIFRYIYHLEALGFESRVVIMGNSRAATAEQVEQEIRSWFFPIKAKVFLSLEQAPPAYITLASNWQTAYAVRNFQSTVHRLYFVQDFEPWFFPAGSGYAFAEETYKFGFIGITAGQWLANKLAAEYGMTTHALGFSYDTELYHPLPKRETTRQVFFYARPSTERRGFEMGLCVLAEVTKRLPDVRVVLAGGDLASYDIPFNHIDVGSLALAQLPDLYSQCEVALVLSFSNLSLLPLELMACGVPVVSNRAPCTTWLLDDDNAKLAESTPEALAQAICDVLENQQEHERLRIAGLQTTQRTSWRNEAQKMAVILSELKGGVS